MSNSFQSLKVLFTRCEVTKLKRKLSGLYIIYSGQLQSVTYYMSSCYFYIIGISLTINFEANWCDDYLYSNYNENRNQDINYYINYDAWIN